MMGGGGWDKRKISPDFRSPEVGISFYSGFKPGCTSQHSNVI